jgi:hypothetical protein
MRKLLTILATAGVLMAGSLIWKAEATPMTGIGSLPTLTKSYAPTENVYYYRRGYYGYRRPYYGYGYGWRRPYYGYGYGWRRPYYRRWRY